jgi:hypothetical protein
MTALMFVAVIWGEKKKSFKSTTKNEEMLNELKKLNDRLKVRKEKFNKSAV